VQSVNDQTVALEWATVHELCANLELDASLFIRNLLYLWQHLTKANGAADMGRAVLVAAPNAWVRQ
jgi:hypothetical protein